MKGITKYTITCDKCGNSDDIGIDQADRINYFTSDNIISARKRFDGEFGFECGTCGNNTLLTNTERRYWKVKQVQPSPLEMKNILENLKPEAKMFTMKKQRAS